MASVSLYPTVSCKDQPHISNKAVSLIKKCPANSFSSHNSGCRCLSSLFVSSNSSISCRGRLVNYPPELFLKATSTLRTHCSKVDYSDERSQPSPENISEKRVYSNSSASVNGSVEKQLKALESYFSKLDVDNGGKPSTDMLVNYAETAPPRRDYLMDSSSECNGETGDVNETSDDQKAKVELDSLNDYFNQLDSGTSMRRNILSDANEETSKVNQVGYMTSPFEEHFESKEVQPHSYSYTKIGNGRSDQVLFDKQSSVRTDDETSDLYLVSALVAINIAVFLFEIASPIRHSDPEQLSIPLIYGAKINKLILLGEWWRLFTPMFLHSGFFHVTFGCWALFTFGSEVCRKYGPLAFFLIYLLGGICGNLTSFIHTPEITVCGTGPVFALIGAWFAYQFQNKEVSSKEATESIFWKAVIATLVSFILSGFGRVDNWAHLGAAISGLIFGYLTCPSLEFDNASSENSRKEGIALIHRHADTCKSLATFTVSILVLAILVFVYAPEAEVEILDWDSFM